MSVAWGPALGTFAGGLILASYGWRPIFFIFGSVTLLWIVPWLWVSKPHWQRASQDLTAVPVREVMRYRTAWSLGIGHFANTYGFYFLLAWLPLFLVKERGFSILQMTAMTTAAYVVQGVSALAWGWLSDRLVQTGSDEGRLRKGLMSLNLAVSAVAILGIGVSASPQGDLRLAHRQCVLLRDRRFELLCHRQIFAGPRAAGTWVGVMNGVGNLSGIVGPILTGMLIEHTGSYLWAFGVSAGIVALGALWWPLALRKFAQSTLAEPRGLSKQRRRSNEKQGEYSCAGQLDHGMNAGFVRPADIASPNATMSAAAVSTMASLMPLARNRATHAPTIPISSARKNSWFHGLCSLPTIPTARFAHTTRNVAASARAAPPR